MKHLRLLFLFSILLQSCVQDDIIKDTINEVLSFNIPLQEITIKESFQYDIKFTNNVGDIETPTITWQSSAPDVITISDSGLVTAIKIGTSTITASILKTDGTPLINKDGEAVVNISEVTVIKAKEKLTINNLLEDLTINNTHLYTATYTNDLNETETPQVTWSTNNTAVISVSNTGLITANSVGQATITASVTINGNNITSEDIVTVVGIAERLSINNPINELNADNNQTHQYTTTYTDQTGQIQTPQITWASSDTNIATVTNDGLVSAIKSGHVIITATVTSGTGQTITDEDSITVTSNVQEKTGTIKTTSSYALTGTFTLREIPGTNDLELSINADYNASTALPGLYLYMTNNPSTVAGAKEIQKVAIFNGAHKYTITNTGINDFNHLLYWCKPFSVKVGDAEIK